MSAKGSLKQARDPQFQALFAIRGVSLNVYKVSPEMIVGPKGNKEFTDLVTIMGCNIGPKFDMNKLQFDKIIISSDADLDGYFIRSLLIAFYFKMFPEIIRDGRLFIAEPPLYRVDDKKDPFVINREDYILRYVKKATKDYRLGYIINDDDVNVEYLSKEEWINFLTETSQYLQDIELIGRHYKSNERLLEIVLEEFASLGLTKGGMYAKSEISKINMQKLIDRINIEFPEIYYDDKDGLIKGSIDCKPQVIDITEHLIIKSNSLIKMIEKWGCNYNRSLLLKDVKTGSEHKVSLLGALKILKKYQPDILHRFKGLGENDEDDIRTTIMDPNTRSLIRVNISDVENEMKVFQMLRGNSTSDQLSRKTMMKEFIIDPTMLDT